MWIIWIVMALPTEIRLDDVDEFVVDEFLKPFLYKDVIKIIISYSLFSRWKYIENQDADNYVIMDNKVVCFNRANISDRLTKFGIHMYKEGIIMTGANLNIKKVYYDDPFIYALCSDCIKIIKYSEQYASTLYITDEILPHIKYIKNSTIYTTLFNNKTEIRKIRAVYGNKKKLYSLININMYLDTKESKLYTKKPGGMMNIFDRYKAVAVHINDIHVTEQNEIIVTTDDQNDFKKIQTVDTIDNKKIICLHTTNRKSKLIYCDDTMIYYTSEGENQSLWSCDRYTGHSRNYTCYNVSMTDQVMVLKKYNNIHIYKRLLATEIQKN